MTRAARSLFAFGIYVVVVGVLFVSAPATMVSLLQLPLAPTGWGRMIGLLALVIGAYDVVAARAECTPYIRASIPVRFAFATATVLLVVSGEMPATLLPLGAIDAAGALWTAFALRGSAVGATA